MELLKALAALIIIINTQCAPEPYQLPPGGDPFQLLQSKSWGWTTGTASCDNNPHVITFTADHSTMTIVLARPASEGTSQYTYDVRAVSGPVLTMALRGETRRNAAGEPVVWELVLFTPNEYRWRDTSWPARQYTAPIRRCPTPAEEILR